MLMPLTRSAVERGALWVAGMLGGKISTTPTPKHPSPEASKLVSWLTETHSRRIDEDARRALLGGADQSVR